MARSKAFGLLMLMMLWSLSALTAILQPPQTARAANLASGCYNGVAAHNGVTALADIKSPFGSTPDVCVGMDGMGGGYYFQLAVTIPDEALSANPQVTAVDSYGISIPMKQDTRKTLFVSSVPVQVAQDQLRMCDTNVTFTLTVKMNGVEDQTPTRSICSSASPSGFDHNTWIRTFDAKGPNNSGTARQFVGFIGINYGQPPTLDPESQYHALQKNGIISIKISGGNCTKDICEFDNGSDEVSLTNGNLIISANKLNPGVSYAIELNYNARAIDDNAPNEWLNHTFSFRNFGNLKATGDTPITSSEYNKDNLAYYDKNNTATPKGDTNPGTIKEGEAVCTAGALGWILCPLTEMTESMMTLLVGEIEKQLTFQPLLGSDQGNAIQAVWRIVVGLANILLVIAFMIVIFSQATSVGLSAYGIKKMLPRIIAAAILINLSYFICALAVDVANVMGASIQGIVESATNSIGNSGNAQNVAGTGWGGRLLVLVTSLVALTVSVATGAIFAIFPFLLAGALTLLAAFVLLAVRTMMITLLIIIAPLAFAAFVLPNTESLYKKWQKLFTILLLMYPLIMLIFYGSSFMSRLLLETKGNRTDGTAWIIDLTAFIMLIVPLFILPMLMKLTGGIMERIGAFVNDREKGLIDRNRKWADEKKGRNTYQQLKAMKKNAGNTGAQRRAITRYDSGNWRAKWGGQGTLGALSGGKLTGQYDQEANVLLGSQATKAVAGINKEEREIIGDNMTRRAAEYLSEGYRLNAAGTHISNGTNSVAMSTLDQGSQAALKYARDNRVMSSVNGLKAVSENLYATGGMTTSRLNELNGMVKAAGGSNADFIAHSNEQARTTGMKHLMFNSASASGAIQVGGNLGPGQQSAAGVASKLVGGGISTISKDTFGDNDIAHSTALAQEIINLSTSNAEAYEKELAKMSPEQVRKMGGMMSVAAANGTAGATAFTGATLDAAYNAAVLKYKP